MTFDDLKEDHASLVELVERALQADFKITFSTSRRAENFRRTFYKFRSTALKSLNEDSSAKLRKVRTKVSGKDLIFSTRQDNAPKELLEALGL